MKTNRLSKNSCCGLYITECNSEVFNNFLAKNILIILITQVFNLLEIF